MERYLNINLKQKMRKIRIFEHISLDGVIEHDGDYEYAGWTTAWRTQAGAEILLEAYGTKFDLLLGRRTYDNWSGFWPTAGDFPMANAINSATKYIVTHHPESLEWGPIESLGEDAIEGIHSLKATDGPDLIVSGSASVIWVLLEKGLADEVVLIVYPVLLGRGKRLFTDSFDAQKLAFVSSLTTSSGLLLNTYRHLGTLKD
jgi:dihydrofolate reductase